MRLGQNRRMRGRNRNSKGPNPLTRSYESNGPDVKVRGTAQHIAEKYSQLSRDAQAAGDPIAAENYLQHAEHYFRIIAASQEQMRLQYNQFQRSDEDGEEGEGDENGSDFAYDRNDQPSMDDPDYGSQPQPYENRQDNRQEGRYDGRRERPQRERRDRFDRNDRNDRSQDNGDRPDNGQHSEETSEQRNTAPRRDRFPRQDRGMRQDRNDRQDRGERGERPMERTERNERPVERADRNERPIERTERNERPVERAERSERPVAERSERTATPRPVRQPRKPVAAPLADEEVAGLPAFLTNPVRQPVVKLEPEVPATLFGESDDEEAPKPIRRRRRTRVSDDSDSDTGGVETVAK